MGGSSLCAGNSRLINLVPYISVTYANYVIKKINIKNKIRINFFFCSHIKFSSPLVGVSNPPVCGVDRKAFGIR